MITLQENQTTKSIKMEANRLRATTIAIEKLIYLWHREKSNIAIAILGKFLEH